MFESIALKPLLFRVGKHRRKVNFANLEIKKWYQDNVDAMVLMIEATVLSEEGKTVTVKYPKNWKEALKERFWRFIPKFLRHRLGPIKYVVHRMTGYNLYPERALPKDHYGVVYAYKEYNTFKM